MELVLPDGTRIPYFKPKKAVVTEVRTIEHIVDNNITRIDHGDDDDNTHILLQGHLNLGEYFIRCVNPQAGGENYFEVRYDGSIKCPYIYSDTTTSLQSQQQTLLDGHNATNTDVNLLNDIVLDFSSEIGFNNLVSRDSNGDSKFRTMTSNYININNSPDPLAHAAHILLNDSALFYAPIAEARMVSNATYRFGVNEDEFDYAGGGDGIEFREYGTELLIQCSDTAPCINIKSENEDVPIFRIQDTNEDSIVEVNSTGTQLRTVQTNTIVVRTQQGDEPNIQLSEGVILFRKSETRHNSGAIYRIGKEDPGSHVDGLDFREDADNRVHLQCVDLSIPLLNIMTVRTDDTPVLVCDIDNGSSSQHKRIFEVIRDGVHTSGIQVRGDVGDPAKFIITEDGDITKCRDITVTRDIECRDITCSDKVECEDLEILNTGSGDDVMAFRIFRDADNPSLKKKVFSITNSGQIRSTFSEQNDLLNAFEDGSVFIGSARHGYKRVSHEPTVEVLKQNYIPKYLTDLGVTLSNYSNYMILTT